MLKSTLRAVMPLFLLGCGDNLHPILGNVSVVYAQCDASCRTVFLTARVRDEGDVTIVVRDGKASTPMLDQSGQAVSFLTGVDARNVVGVRKNDVVSIDLEKSRYRVVHSHPHAILHPRLFGDQLVFSDALSVTQRSVNRYHHRRLQRYDLRSGKLERALAPWVAYGIGTPSLTQDGRLCLTLVLPHVEDPSVATDTAALAKRTSFCFATTALFGHEADEQVLQAAVIPGPVAAFEHLQVDTAGRYAAGYSLATPPSAWMIYDLQNGKVLRRFDYTRHNAVALSADGKRYLHAEGKRGAISGTVYDTGSGNVVSKFEVELDEVGKQVIQQSR